MRTKADFEDIFSATCARRRHVVGVWWLRLARAIGWAGRALLAAVVAALVYGVGWRDGRIRECRMSWPAPAAAVGVWTDCEARLGRALVVR